MAHQAVTTVLTTVLTAWIAIVLLSSACSAQRSHNLTIGSHTWGEHLLQREIVKADWKWFRIVSKQVTFSGDGISKITIIKALDQAHDGKGAEAVLLAGGPGQSWATLKFQSQRSNPIDFIVEIYGKREP